jgi:hypothetical protein
MLNESQTSKEKLELYTAVIHKIVDGVVHENFFDLIQLFEVIPDQALKNYVDGKPQSIDKQ